VLRITALKDREDWVVLNDTGDSVRAGDIETDARQAQVTIITGKTPSRHVLMIGGTYLKLKGETIATGTPETPVDKDF
jgi:hypothetical protein